MLMEAAAQAIREVKSELIEMGVDVEQAEAMAKGGVAIEFTAWLLAGGGDIDRCTKRLDKYLSHLLEPSAEALERLRTVC